MSTNSCSNYVKYVLAAKQANPCSCCYNQNPNQNITINCDNNSSCGSTCGGCGGALPTAGPGDEGKVLTLKTPEDGRICPSWEDNTAVGEPGKDGENGMDAFTILFRPWSLVLTTEDSSDSGYINTNLLSALDNEVYVFQGSNELQFKNGTLSKVDDDNNHWTIQPL